MKPNCNLTHSAAGRGAAFEETESPTRRACPLALLLTRRACLWAALGLLAALAFLGLPARAAVTEAWVHRYSNMVSNADDYAVKVVRDAAGDIIVTGTTDDRINGPDMVTIKYSGADGSVLWQKRYNGPANSDDQPTGLAVDGSGNVVVTGYSVGTNNADYYTAKYAAADGALLWEKRYNSGGASAVAVDGSGNVVVTGYSATIKYLADGTGVWTNNAGATAIAVDGSGNVVVTGTSYNGTNYDYYTARYAAADGALLWEKRYNGPANSDDQAQALALDGNGNVAVTGYSKNATNSDYYTAKYAAADGALLWEKRYNSPSNGGDFAFAVAMDSSGNVVVTGGSASGLVIIYAGYSYDIYDYYTAKYAAADGALLWEKRYHGVTARAVAVDGSDNVLVTGDSGAIKYLANGTAVWTNNASGIALALDGSGNVVVTGNSYNGNNADYSTAKYAAADGALLWEKRYNGPVNLDAQARAVAVDGHGNVVVTGASVTRLEARPLEVYSIYDYYTAKYAAADGVLLWEQRYNGPVDDIDEAYAVAVDGSNNVVVTGRSVGTNGHYEYCTAKYAAADGALLWEKRYSGPGGGYIYNQAQAVAVDASGNVVVTGFSQGDADYYTAKYAAANGALLWEQRYNGPANNGYYAQAVAVDGSGNVVVTGLSATIKYLANGTGVWTNTGGNALAVDGSGNVLVAGGATAKYAAANGALLWQKHFTNSSASAVAVDGSGNVVVTGDSYNGTNSDYYTAKYAAANGALLWEKRYNGPANDQDHAYAVALDGSGNVVVTGNSYGGANGYDYYTAKYAAADGALLWEKRYNGPANGNDFAISLALGPNGMVAVTGTSSSGYATVVYRENLPPVAIDLVPTGIRLRFAGVPGHSYNIERAPAVTGPWSTLATPTAPLGGLIEYVDTNPPVSTAFYRTSAP